MNFSLVKRKATELFSEANFLSQISRETEYESALKLMDELIEEYDDNRALIILLSNSIEEWEENAEEFREFNSKVAELDNGEAVLKTLMDQYQLKAEDLKKEIGSKSLISMILNGKRNLTVEHIQSLADKFHISPSVFFNSNA